MEKESDASAAFLVVLLILLVGIILGLILCYFFEDGHSRFDYKKVIISKKEIVMKNKNVYPTIYGSDTSFVVPEEYYEKLDTNREYVLVSTQHGFVHISPLK
jgi:hypothetical protein